MEKQHQKAEDQEQLERLRAGLMPFQLVKYFSFTSLAVILVFTLILSWLISKNAKKVMLDQSEAYSLLLAENLNQQIFRGFVLPTVVRYGKIALSNPEQFETLDKIVRNATRTMKIEGVNIYDSNINIISYSTRKELVGRKDIGGSEYEKALLGETNSQFHSRGTLLNIMPGTPPVSCNLQTFIPFRLMQSGKSKEDIIMGVIEITQDLSREYSAIVRLQGKIVMFSSVVMAVLFIVLRKIVSRADTIMERRVHERLELEKKLHDVERLAYLGTMVATVSHEIKSPLGIVRSTAEILVKRIRKVAPGSENLAEIIVSETSRLNNIVMEFLDFARPQKLKMKPVVLNQLIANVLNFLQADLQAKNIELYQELDRDISIVLLDYDLFYRAMLNILVNGIQAMPEGGTLLIKSIRSPGEETFSIAVEDTGSGMSEGTLAEIFKPFVTNKNRGTGLGLAITKNIIELHRGTIAVHSKEGKGSTFTITMPMIVPRPADI